MKVIIRSDSVEVEGYVNAVERDSKVLYDRQMGKFIERISAGAFRRALEKNNNVLVLLNHDRVLGSQQQGNLELEEDAIGLRARAVISDPETINDARNGNLVGWSFGFNDVPDGVERTMEGDIPLRKVNDMDLLEVSILNRSKIPAYDGTLIITRDTEGDTYHSEAYIYDEVEYVREEPKQEESSEAIDYSKYENMISEMKGE